VVEKGAVKECVLEFGVLYLNNKTQWFLKNRDMGEGEPWLLLAMFGHTSITLYY
jgi:hypothetical protein